MFRLDTKTLIMQDTMKPKPFMKLHFEFFPPLFHEIYFPRAFFIIMNEKALIEEKNLVKSRGYKELKCDFKMAMIPLCLETFFRKRHLRQSHCKMSILTFVQTVVLYLSNIRPVTNQVEKKFKIRLAQMLWYFWVYPHFVFPSKRLGVKEAFQKGF